LSTQAASGSDWATQVHAAFTAADIRTVGYVPDAGLIELIELCREDHSIRDVVLASEQEGIGLAAGAWLGGARAVLMMQSSGVGNCINALSMIQVCGFPLLALVTMRGEWGEANPWQVPMGQGAASHLAAAGVIVHRVERAQAVAETVAAAAQLAFASSRAVAVLVAQRVLGAKTFQD
jgi:sulfopyruvate decarboxylase alpha subunit